MTDIYSREETELAVFGWLRQSFRHRYMPPEISKIIQKYWDDTNYFILESNEFSSFLAQKQKTFSHIQPAFAAFQLASFNLKLDKTPKSNWTLQIIDIKPNQNGYFPICCVYFEIFCEEIDYYYKDTYVFDNRNDRKTWIDPTLSLNKVNKLPKYINDSTKQKTITFCCFIQLLSKKYRMRPRYLSNSYRTPYLRDSTARFDDYHKKIVMKQNVEYTWRNIPQQKRVFSPSFDHANWCLKYTKNSNIYLKLLRVHGLIEKLVIKCTFYIVRKPYETFLYEDCETKKFVINCENLKWILVKKCGCNIMECCVQIEIIKAFKMTENEIKKIPQRYWYIYGIKTKHKVKYGKDLTMRFTDVLSIVD